MSVHKFSFGGLSYTYGGTVHNLFNIVDRPDSWWVRYLSSVSYEVQLLPQNWLIL